MGRMLYRYGTRFRVFMSTDEFLVGIGVRFRFKTPYTSWGMELLIGPLEIVLNGDTHHIMPAEDGCSDEWGDD
jgi:hypothetical protein